MIKNFNFRFFIKRIRWAEALLIFSFPVLAVFISLKNWADFDFGQFTLFCLATYLLIIHIYVFNDWAALKNEWLKKLSLILAVLSLSLYLKLSLTSFIMAAVIIFLSFVYSHPLIKIKAKPMTSSLLHAVGAILLFLLGYSLVNSPGLKGLLIAFYFALIICAGHLTQETIDIAEDKLSKIETNAIKFGKIKTLIASFILFNISFLYLLFLILKGYFAFIFSYGALAAYIGYICLFILTLKKEFSLGSLVSFRQGYRVVHVILGLYMGFLLLWQIQK